MATGAPRSFQCSPATCPRYSTMPAAPIPRSTLRASTLPATISATDSPSPSHSPQSPGPTASASKTSGPDSSASAPSASEVRRGTATPRRPSSSHTAPRARNPYPSTVSHGHPSRWPPATMVATTATNSATCCSARRSSRYSPKARTSAPAATASDGSARASSPRPCCSTATSHHVQGMVQLAVTSPRQPMTDHLAAGSLQRCSSCVSSEVMLAGEPTDVADLTHKGGRQHRPDAEQLDQTGLGLSDRGLDPCLDFCDPLLQLA